MACIESIANNNKKAVKIAHIAAGV